MTIDIDSFLEKYQEDNLTLKGEKIKDSKETNLEFQKDVENRLENVSKIAKNSDFFLLQKIYEEVKNFDLDLSNKFLSIEKKGDETLSSLGSKYSKEYLENLKNYAFSIENKISKDLINLKNHLEKNDFSNMIFLLKDLIKNYNSYPREFISKKIKINLEIKKIEIKIYETLKLFKENQLKEIKIKLKEKILSLNKQLVPGNAKKIEAYIDDLNNYINSIHKIFISDIIEEKIYVSKIISKSENYLDNEYKKEFEYRKESIYQLFDKFHKYYLNRDVEKTVLTYDEILFEFNNLPEVFIEEKIKIYEQINIIYSSINNLILKNNISMFMSNYQASQVIQEVKDYLKHSNITNRLNLETLNLLKQKLSQLPKKFDFEKKDLENEIDNYLLVIKNRLEKNEIEVQKLKKGKINFQEIIEENDLSLNKNDNKDSLKLYKKESNFSKNVVQKEDLNDDIKKKDNIYFSNDNKDNNNYENLNEQIVSNFNLSFERLKKEENFEDFLRLYQQILKEIQIETKIKDENKEKIKKKLLNLLIEKEDIEKKNKRKGDDLNSQKHISPQQDILAEINNNYEKLKKTNNKEDIKKYYKKIIFYLNLLNIKKSKKNEILSKVKKLLLEKKIY